MTELKKPPLVSVLSQMALCTQQNMLLKIIRDVILYCKGRHSELAVRLSHTLSVCDSLPSHATCSVHRILNYVLVSKNYEALH
jgi:hypothetical protein